ncbi:MAG: hypothetical protein ABJA67_05985 [Chthonomonadales bacterium]
MKSSLSLTLAAIALSLGGAAIADGNEHISLGRVANEAGTVATVKKMPTSPYLHLAQGVTEYNFNGIIQLNGTHYQAANFQWAPFYSRNWQYGANFGIFHQNDTNGSIEGIVNYYPGQDDKVWYPYLGGAVGFNWGPGSHDTVYGGQAGIKYGLDKNVALTAEFQYRKQGDHNMTSLVGGVSYFTGDGLVGTSFNLPRKGSREFQFVSDFNFNTGARRYFAIDKGWFWDDVDEFLFGVIVDHDTDFTTGGVRVGVEHHFLSHSWQMQTSRFLPFVGGYVGTEFGDGDNSGFAGAEGGFKYYLNENIALKAFLDYTHRFKGPLDKDNLAIRWGMIYNH